METIISILLIVGLVRWGLSVWSPEILEFLGYSLESYQRGVDSAPPVRYLTQVRRGYVRNGSIFGGPTSWGFFLVAFAPWYLWRMWQKMQISGSWRSVGWIVLLVVNVGLTFSRAAWGVFAIEVVGMVLLISPLGERVLSLPRGGQEGRGLGSDSFWSPILKAIGAVIFGVVATIGLIRLAGPVDVPQAADRDQGLITRDLSDTGHWELLVQGVEQVMESPRVGYGVASVGPGAYRTSDDSIVYHPENQYIQILMEVGVPGFVIWMGLWGVLLLPIWKLRQREGYMLLLGAIGLTIAGLVLHSMMESMSIYPWMLLMGAWLGSRRL